MQLVRGLLESWEWHCALDSGVRVPGPQLFLVILPGFYHIHGELPGKQLEGSLMSQAIPGSSGGDSRPLLLLEGGVSRLLP